MTRGPLLAIETSCDETAAAILDEKGVVLADIVSTQIDVHAAYGGVVPEVASREHLVRLDDVVGRALAAAGLAPDALGAVAATYGPGLVGALLVGLTYGKGLASALSVPFVGVHHIEGHLAAAFGADAPPAPPFIGLVVSGGHTALYRYDGPGQATLLGETRDDAAGEAFDKTAKLLGLGYPGGAIIDRLADDGDPRRFKLPVSLRAHTTLDFSFSGLKTAVRLLVEKEQARPGGLDAQTRADLCASLRAAVVEALVGKAILACRRSGLATLVVGGGVAANRLLREELVARAAARDIVVHVPPRRLCTDNAVMIARAGLLHLAAGRTSALSVRAAPGARVDDVLRDMSVHEG